jgi:Tfp pilus assembly protein PilZ
VTEYTTCVSKGGCALVVERPLEYGTRFEFEMYVQGEDEPLAIEGEVVRVQPLEGLNKYEIGIQYITAGKQEEVLDRLLSRIMIDPSFELVRKYPRIPVNLVAHDPDPRLRYLIRDLSSGGMRIEARSVPRDVAIGVSVDLLIMFKQRVPFKVSGKVAWIHRGSHQIRTRLGVQFDEDRDELSIRVVEALVRLARPRHLDLAFQTPLALEMAARPPEERVARGAEEIGMMMSQIATAFLLEKPELGLSVLEGTAGRGMSLHTDQVRVGIVGDIIGEIAIDASIQVGVAIASAAVGDGTRIDDRQMVADALTELTTELAGFVCDKLDELDVEMEVTAPIPGPLPIELDGKASVIELALGGPGGRVFLTVVTREPEVNLWPV